MNDPVQAFAAISALLARLAGLHAKAVGPADAGWRLPSPAEQARVDFDLISNVGLGVDEWATEFDPDAEIEGDTSGPGGAAATGGIIYTAQGDRVQTWQVKVECGRQDATAHRYAERIRNGLGLPSTRAALAAVGLGLQLPVGATRPAHFAHDGRQISAAIFEFRTNSVGSATETEAITTIGEVSGVALPSSDAGPGDPLPFEVERPEPNP